VGEVQQQPSQRTSSPEEVWCNLRSRVLLLDFEHVMYYECRTTRPADNSDRDKSARKWGQVGP
jgi:hypothetical protein